MEQLINFIKKEFLHIFRDRKTLIILLAIPIIELLLFGYAISTEIRNIPLAVMDYSKSQSSEKLTERISSNPYFHLKTSVHSYNGIEKEFKKGQIKMLLIFPHDFDTDLTKTGNAEIQVLTDASDPNEATNEIAYIQGIVLQFQNEINKGRNFPLKIDVKAKMLYNPELSSSYNFVPGIMGLILLIICAMMTSISIVKEKEQGTMEILLVSPVRPYTVVISKSIPYLAIAFIDILLILAIAHFMIGVPITGNIFVIVSLCMLYAMAALSLGLFISSITKSEQTAMMISGAGLMMPTIFLSGLMFPLENMPLFLRIIANIIPAKWFITALKKVMIEGLGVNYIWKETGIIILFTIVLLILSIKKFKNRL